MNGTVSNADSPTLQAARALFKAVGYEDAAIDRALHALDDSGEARSTFDPLLTAREVCDWLGISLSTLWRWEIPHVKISGLRRFYRRDVERFLNSRYVRRT